MRRALSWLMPAFALAQVPDFPARVYPMLEKAQCRGCHNSNGVASASRLQFPPEGAPAAELTRFGLSLGKLVDRAQPDASLLIRKPTLRVAHPGGERIAPGSEEERLLTAWVRHLAGLPESSFESATVRKPLTVVLRRLTHSQYNNTVADLLGDRTLPANQFPAEDFVHGYTNQAEGQNISPLMAEDYARAAAKLARNAERAQVLNKLIPCDRNAPGCGVQFVRSFGERAFRRPLSDAEVALFVKLLGPNFDAVMVVEAMLTSPGFLFHTGTGPHATAARLSYLLWDSAPDEALHRAAQGDGLKDKAQIEAQARRLLADPRARGALNQFLAEWLRFDRVKGALRERKLFPEFGTELIQSMLEETTRLYEHLVWSDRNFMELFTARYSFLNQSLAQLYELPAPATEFGRVDFPAASKRSGILGHASFLTLTSKPAETAPTERGLFIRDHFLCQIVPPPPPGVSTTLPTLTEDRPMTNRERLAVHLSNASCAACHRLVDPIGFGFEQFDAIGRYREQQVALIYPAVDQQKRNVRRDGLPVPLKVDTSATILGLPASDFASPAEAGAILGRSPVCQRCVVKQFFRYALGRKETAADEPYLEEIFQRFVQSGFQFRELVVATVTSRPFLEESHNAR